MPSIESSIIDSRKQELIWGKGVPALKSVGVACVNHFWLSSWYVSRTRAMSLPWMPTDTRINICCGLSASLPLTLSR